MELSILIPSLYETERLEMLSNLKGILFDQIEDLNLSDQIEVLTCIDNKERTTGAKRNELLELSNGKYIVFIDDDDLVSENYISLIMEGIEKDVDVIGIKLKHYLNNKLHGNTVHSLKYDKWENIPHDNGIWEYKRCPNHLNPVKREYAIKAGFPDKTIGEDKEYSMKLRPMLFIEHFIEEPVYYYMQKS